MELGYLQPSSQLHNVLKYKLNVLPSFGLYESPTSSSSGNVLFLILIAVVLFAALSYAVTSSTSGNGRSVDKEKIDLAISTAQQQAQSFRVAILRMKTAGTSETEISFVTMTHGIAGENASYANPNCSSESCEVFNIERWPCYQY